jgi:hypothetical protein
VDFMIAVTQVVPGGLALVQRHETGSSKDTWMLANVPAGTLTPLPAPQTKQYVAPYLADDGRHTGWVLVIPNTGPPVLEELHIFPVSGTASERVLDLTPFGPNTYELIGLDDSTGESLYWVSQPLPDICWRRGVMAANVRLLRCRRGSDRSRSASSCCRMGWSLGTPTKKMRTT